MCPSINTFFTFNYMSTGCPNVSAIKHQYILYIIATKNAFYTGRDSGCKLCGDGDRF